MARVMVVVGLLCMINVAARAQSPAWIARSAQGMVASDSPQASQVGADVLADGGNAFDAAVATSLALGVTRPFSTGLGGGGFMVAYLADEQKVVALDFREMAPASATPARFSELIAQSGDGLSPSLYGGNAVGVPGLFAGLTEINTKYGSRSLRRLARPAIQLAEEGFEADQAYVGACAHVAARCEAHEELRRLPGGLAEMVLASGRPPKVGQRVRNLALGRALRLLAAEGADGFYRGEIAEAIVQAVNAAGGAMTMEDLAGYRVKERTPVVGRIGPYTVASMPPPSSGGVALLQTWKTLARSRARLEQALTPPLEMHLRIEAMKHAFADRARWLGDADFAKVPVDYLTSDAYAEQLARRIDPNRAGSPTGYGVTQLPDDAGTSHFCVVDAAGNVVAITETINATFGSFVVAGPFGIVLNNEMDDFLTKRGEANLYGLVQGEANLVGPGKRPLSSMSPTIVLMEGRPVLTLGASGGPRIISSVLNVMLNVLEVGLPLDEAIASVRVHHQWRPDEVYCDRPPTAEARAALEAFGHAVSDESRLGVVQAIQVLPDGTLVGASDPRKGGRPAGCARRAGEGETVESR